MIKKMKLEDVCEKASSNLAQKDLVNSTGDYPVYGASGYIKNVSFYHQKDKYVAVVKDGAGIGRTFLLPEKSAVIGTLQYLIPKDNIEAEYLYYAVTSMKLKKYYAGATIPHIYFKDYKKETLLLPDKNIQKKIVYNLKKIEKIVTYRKQQLLELDILIKSRFIEMFGDPITNPMKWDKYRLNDVCNINPKKINDNRLIDDLKVSFVSMSSVSEKGEINTSVIKSYEEVKSGFTYFAENDVLFAKITPCMENGKGAIAINLKNGIGFGSTEFHVIRPIEGKTNAYWVYCLTMFDFFRNDAERKMTGSAGQRRVPASFLINYIIGVPPIDRQNQFASFVQHINKTKVEIKKSLDEVQLLFDSLMQKYFG